MVTQLSQYSAVQDLFAQTAAKFGASLAIDNGVRRITYRELQAEVDRLAQVLAQRGVGEASIVAVFLSDPIGIITSILAVLKCGGVFCALDPTFPQKRVQVMFESVEPKWCITSSRLQEKLQGVVGGLSSRPEILFSDNLPAADDYNLRPGPLNPEAPCSIYFTSGSTGRPKAILGRLKGIDHFIRWEIETVGA